jgi:TatD DNase family protein
MYDAHIHLDWYPDEEQDAIIQDLKKQCIKGVVAVSSDLISCKKVLELSNKTANIFPALGWHPEQPLPSQIELNAIMNLIRKHHKEIVAIGEVGLPYYLKQENSSIQLSDYKRIISEFFQLAKQYELPIVLHAIYEDAAVICDLLEKYDVEKAHFHWFKGSKDIMKRMIQRGYRISITPDCMYEEEIKEIVAFYPLELMMVETDGPWQFEGPYREKSTHPYMIKDVIAQIARIKKIEREVVIDTVTRNTEEFYKLN